MTKADLSKSPHTTRKNRRARPWNRGRAVGQMQPFTYEEVQLIKQLLKNAGRLRDLVLFSVGIDSMLRASDLLRLKIDEVWSYLGPAMPEITLRQQKTGKAVTIVLGEETCRQMESWIDWRRAQPEGVGQGYLFTGTRRGRNLPITTDRLRVLVKEWASMAHLDPRQYSSHSLRRTKAALIYAETGNIEAIRRLLGHHSIAATSAYLGIEDWQALEIARMIEM